MSSYSSEKLQQQWQTIVADWQKSGLSKIQYCKNNNLSRYKLSYWVAKLQSNNFMTLNLKEKVSLKEGAINANVSFIKIELKDVPVTQLVKVLKDLL